MRIMNTLKNTINLLRESLSDASHYAEQVELSMARGVPTITTWGAQEDRENEAYERGKELGFETAIEQAFSLKFNYTKPLSEEDEAKLMDFLIENNLEVCFDHRLGGLRIRKLMTEKEHAKEMVTRSIEGAPYWK
jgi:hypothetical protein